LPWGRDYWTLTYVQEYRDQLPGLNFVDHNADPREIVARGDHLFTPDQTFIIFPLAYYEERLGPLYLAAVAPGVTEISPGPIVTVSDLVADLGVYEVNFDLGNGAEIRAVKTEWTEPRKIMLTVYWQTGDTVDNDYSVGVHLVAQDPPKDEADILDQDDSVAPVNGWYPTSRWRPGEIVRDRYLVTVPVDAAPASIRVGMYRSDPVEGIFNTPWLSLPLPLLE
jgi:hypothetical protein